MLSVSRVSRISESAYDADRTDVKRLDSAVDRCDGGDSGDETGEAPLLAGIALMVGDKNACRSGEKEQSRNVVDRLSPYLIANTLSPSRIKTFPP